MFAAKTIVITGATGALGSALVKRFLEQRAVVIAIDKNASALSQMADTHSKEGAEFVPLVCDLLDTEQVALLWKKLDTMPGKSGAPRIDVWINNAGTTAVGGFQHQAPEVWDRVFELNFHVPVRLTREVLQRMQKQGRGTVVNLASVAGCVPAAWMTAYTASKHALVGFTRALQEELRQANTSVDVVLINPGFFESNLIVTEQASFPEWLRPILGEPDSVARDILVAIRKRRSEAVPTWNGKVLLRLYRAFPKLVTKSSKLMLTRGPWDVLLNRYTPPKSSIPAPTD